MNMTISITEAMITALLGCSLIVILGFIYYLFSARSPKPVARRRAKARRRSR